MVRKVTAIEGHTLSHVQGCLNANTVLDIDNALPSGPPKGFRYHSAEFGVVGRYCCNRQDAGTAFKWFCRLLEVFDGFSHGEFHSVHEFDGIGAFG